MNKKLLFILFIGAGFLVGFIKIKFWSQNVLDGDSWGYYNFLPSAFIYHDLGNYDRTVAATRLHKPAFKDPLSDRYSLYHKHPQTGKMVVKYTSGVAMLLSPFFFLSHAYASLTGEIADGFSSPYRIGMGIGVIFWVCLGLYFLLCVLRRYFNRFTSALTILALAFGTNLFYNTAYNSIMSHALLFSLYSILIYLTDTYYKQVNKKRAFLIGLAIGSIALVRLNEFYCLFIPLLWGLSNGVGLRDRFNHFRVNFSHIGIAFLAGLLVFLPQILYWKTFANAWIFNGYIGEKFDFRHPHIWEGLFSYDNGWLVWSPIMAIALPGIVLNWFKVRPAFWPTVFVLPIHVYFIYSWWCWNYINGFGSRPMEHMYPLLAFAMAGVIEICCKKNVGKIAFSTLIVGAIALNFFQMFQNEKGLLVTQHANEAYYWTILGQTKPSHNIMVARSSNEIQPNNPTRLSALYSEDFEDSTRHHGLRADPHYQGQFSIRISDQSLLLDTLDMKQLENGDYLKVSGACYFKNESDIFHNVWDTPFLYIQWQDKNGKNIRKYDSGINPFQFAGNPGFSIFSTGSPNIWGPFYYFVKIPHQQAHHGVLGIWNANKAPFYLDDLKVELYRK